VRHKKGIDHARSGTKKPVCRIYAQGLRRMAHTPHCAVYSTTRGNGYHVEPPPKDGQYWSLAVAGLIIMYVPPKTWKVARGPLLVAIYLIIRHPYSKEASRPKRKQLLPLVRKEAISKKAISKEAIPKEAIPKEAIPKEAIPKEAIPKEAIPKEAILNAPTSFHPLPPKDENNRAHNKIP
jgi:hypothetical protein